MRILLVGEYSGYHNALKHGLQQLGHKVTLVGDGDGFKNYPVDVFIGSDWFRRNWFREKFKVAWWKLTGRNLEDNLRYASFRESKNKLKDHDIVQFINSNALGCEPAVELKMMQWLVANNGKCYLAACGDDAEYAQYLMNDHQGYSILDPVKKDVRLKPYLGHTYKYLEKGYQENYHWLVQHCEAVIPSNVDYAMALTNQKKATKIIPAPVQTSRHELTLNTDLSTIEIFMGINRPNYYKKGIYYFEEALKRIKEKYNDQIKITIAENLPYHEYINSFSSAHILLDQVLCYDQGYNALEAMLKGKVVFAGAGNAYKTYHAVDQVPVIDAQPDVDYLVAQLVELIENPETLLEKGRQARELVLEMHDCVKIASRFLEVYN
ncbi:glycosyltransferase family protein [Nonlabens ponticola]|uniref:Glycosyltransferase family 1 protein n=1 Tax=Nonlabens ponticola TaxID=2496866 RepID=A0A3S9MWU1_9FLAO|nr:glycosyltransferase family 1 protein [Nonlabens ponticola]AZQ43681.1 glycosyltransferase family 1 protein [Nonlabens ponticola]